MKWLILISALCIIAGIGFAAYAMTMPYYTSEAAYDRIQKETGDKMDAAKGKVLNLDPLYDEFYSRMSAITTPHKKLSDLGRGLCAVGLGGLAAIGIGVWYQRWAWMRTFKNLLRIWILLWALQIPLSIWYHLLREVRGDYPGWADSISVGILGAVLYSVVGAVLSTILLSRLIKHRQLPETISFDEPETTIELVRVLIFISWLVILWAGFVAPGIVDGNEGDVFTCMAAGSVLLIYLSAKPGISSDDSSNWTIKNLFLRFHAFVMSNPNGEKGRRLNR